MPWHTTNLDPAPDTEAAPAAVDVRGHAAIIAGVGAGKTALARRIAANAAECGAAVLVAAPKATAEWDGMGAGIHVAYGPAEAARILGEAGTLMHDRSGPAAPLLVVVDEAGLLTRERPGAAGPLADLLQYGAPVGVSVVAAYQAWPYEAHPHQGYGTVALGRLSPQQHRTLTGQAPADTAPRRPGEWALLLGDAPDVRGPLTFPVPAAV